MYKWILNHFWFLALFCSSMNDLHLHWKGNWSRIILMSILLFSSPFYWIYFEWKEIWLFCEWFLLRKIIATKYCYVFQNKLIITSKCFLFFLLLLSPFIAKESYIHINRCHFYQKRNISLFLWMPSNSK